jgi:BASS family bile acid:Na+ symporter
MHDRKGIFAVASHFAHRNLIWFLIGTYALASAAPEAGLWIRALGFTVGPDRGSATRVTLPAILLGLLIFNAGLNIEIAKLRRLLASPAILLLGLLANLIVPVGYILGLSQSLALWHNPDEVQDILVGLALVASMPIAGSSTAWSQQSDGDLSLSLGLVVFSTCLSPLTTPVALHAVGWVASGPYADGLRQLADGGTTDFLAWFVFFPSLLGMMTRRLLGGKVIARAKPGLLLLNVATLLTLNYSNASLSLPQVIANPDWDFLILAIGLVLTMCVIGFAMGKLVAQTMRTSEGEKTALVYGLGMNNNGTGLVLASNALAHLPNVMAPIILYTLVQHLVAGVYSSLRSRIEPVLT